MLDKRKGFDEALSYIFTTIVREYMELSFYGEVISQCKVVFTEDIELIGVGFTGTFYTIRINPVTFNVLPVEHRIGIVVHEALHVVYNHAGRRQHRDPLIWNYAADCAINQQIKRHLLPDFGIFPENLKVPLNLNDEQYYELLIEDPEKCKTLSDFGGQVLDSHDWDEYEVSATLQEAITKELIKTAVSKTKGTLPSNINEILELYNNTPKINWKRELQRIIGSTQADREYTPKKPNRRYPDRLDLMGKRKTFVFTLICIVDVSGSMSTEEIMDGLNEIHTICKVWNIEMQLIQVDTKVQNVETFTKTTRLFTRKASGGTRIYPAIEYILDNKLECDAIIIITDGGIESLSSWDKSPKIPILFLTTDRDIPDIALNTRYKQFDLRSS